MADWTGLEPATSGVTGRHSNQLNYQSIEQQDDTCLGTAIATANRYCMRKVADWTGLEPATSGVTGRHSNQLNYQSTFFLYASRASLRDGGWYWARTSDPQLVRLVLFQLS